MSEENKHIDPMQGQRLTSENKPTEAPDPEPGRNPADEEKHKEYLQAADPLFRYAQSKALFPDGYQAVLDALENAHQESDPHQEAPIAEEREPDVENEQVVLDEAKSDIPSTKKEQDDNQPAETNDGGALGWSSSEEPEPASPFIRWLSRLEKPRIAGESGKEMRNVKSEPDPGMSASKQTTVSKPVDSSKHKPLVNLEPEDRSAKVIRSKAKKEQGMQLSPDVISETLADVLAAQGHTHAAIEMYEKLSLIYPEKKSFFAIKIEKLQKR